MDEIELTKLFVQYADTKKTLENLRAQIETAITNLGESRKVAGITATYYKPSFETPDYEQAARAGMPAGFELDPYSTTTTTTRWKEVCEVLKIEVPQGKEKPARVVVK